MDFIYSQYTNTDYASDWVSPNLSSDRHHWVNDEFATAPLEYQNKTSFHNFGKCYGHFSRPILEGEYLGGCNIVIDGVTYLILKIMGDGTECGSVILNGNPPSGTITNIYSFEHTNDGMQLIFSDDAHYDKEIHGEWCQYDSWGINGYTHGDYIVNTKNYLINDYTTLVGEYDPGAREVEVEDVSRLLVDQEILFHQTQQCYNLKMAGAYSYNYIDKIDVSTKKIQLRYPLGEYFKTVRDNQIDSCVCQVVTVPHFKSLTILKDCSLICLPWNGKYGGIIVFRALKYFENYGTIDVSYCGFRGGKDHIKWWWYQPCGPVICYPLYRSFIANCGGEGLAGLDLNWGLISNPIPEEPLSYYTNPAGVAYPIDIDPGNWPKQDPETGCWDPLIYRNITPVNVRRKFGGGSYRIEVCSYNCTHFDDYAGSTPGSGGGSYDPGENTLGTGYHRCYFVNENAYYTWPISELGGDQVEVDRGLRLNLGAGGASGFMWHLGIRYNDGIWRQPRRTWPGGIGGNGGGLILINTKVCNNFGEFISNGDHGSLNFYWYDLGPGNKLVPRDEPEASTAGGGGAGTIAIFSKAFNNFGNLELSGGKGYQLREGIREVASGGRYGYYIFERREYHSGAGGDGHFVYTATQGTDKSVVKCAKKEYVDNLYELRINGYFGYDYRLMWSQPNPIWMSHKAEIDMTKIFRMNNYYLVYDERNDGFYNADVWYRYGIKINNRLKLYDFDVLDWYEVKDFNQIKTEGEDQLTHLAMTAEDYNKRSGICSYVNQCLDNQDYVSCGAYFAVKSEHQIFCPLITEVQFDFTKYPYGIWNVVKHLDTNTVPVSEFGGMLDF